MKTPLAIVTGLAASAPHAWNLPLTYPYKNIMLRINGTLNVGGFAATLNEDGILGLIQDLRVKTTGPGFDGEAISADAYQIMKSNYMRSKAIPLMTQPAVGVANNPFEMYLLLPFNFLGTLFKDASFLNAPKLSSLQLTLTTGAAANIATAGGGGTIALGGLTISAVAEVEPQINPNQVISHRFMNRLAIATAIAGASNIQDRHDLKGSGWLKSILIETENAGAANSDVIIGAIKAYGTRKLAGGANGDKIDLTETTFGDIRASNVVDFGVSSDGLTTPSTNLTGCALLEFDPTGRMDTSKMPYMDGLQDVKLQLEFLAAGTYWITLEFVKNI